MKFKTSVLEIGKVLATPAGETLIKALEEEFVWGDLMGTDDRSMWRNMGARDVVLRLREMKKTAELAAGEKNNG